MRQGHRLLLVGAISVGLTQVAFAQKQPGPGFHLAFEVTTAQYPPSFADSNGVGGDDVLAGYDLDGDGKGEFIFITDNLVNGLGPALFVFEATGDDTYELVWYYRVRDHGLDNASFPTMTVGDLDNDGLLEIIAGIPYATPEPANPARLLVFEVDPVTKQLPTTPTAIWNFDADPGSEIRCSASDAADVDGDGRQEVIMVFRRWASGGLPRVNALMIFSLDGDFAGEFTVFKTEFFDPDSLRETNGNIYEVKATDLNGDGKKEIVTMEWGFLHTIFYESTGPDQYRLAKKIKTPLPDFSAGSLNSLLPADIDKDGTDEFLLAGSDGRVYLIEVPNGDFRQITPSDYHVLGRYPQQIRGASIGDFDEDGNVDFFIAGSYNERIFRLEYKGSGALTDSTSYEWTTVYTDTTADTRYYYVSFPQDLFSKGDGQTLTDMDGDGKREVVFTTQEGADFEAWVTVVEAESPVAVRIRIPASIPEAYALHQNYPNPFNPSTTIRYNLPKAGHVTLKVYNLLGQEIKTLVDREQGIGSHTVLWDATDNSGHRVTSGTYIYELRAGDFRESKRMTLTK